MTGPECSLYDTGLMTAEHAPFELMVPVMVGQLVTQGEFGVFVSYNGTEDQLTAWEVPYATALTRTFLEPRPEGEWWLPVETTTSPIVSVEDREGFFRTVLVTVRMQTVT
jgi:hypothetical protein